MRVGFYVDISNRLPVFLSDLLPNFGAYLKPTSGKKYKKCHGANRQLRTKKIDFMVSEEEYALIDFYLKKYKITNRSRWFRRLMIGHILKHYEEDYPTLFNENEMRR